MADCSDRGGDLWEGGEKGALYFYLELTVLFGVMI